MLALQGPGLARILVGLIEAGGLPEPLRNELQRRCAGGGAPRVRVARTGYTGEPLCFELFAAAGRRAGPLGRLGAGRRRARRPRRPRHAAARGRPAALRPRIRRRLRGRRDPHLRVALARFAVSFSPRKGEFIGRAALPPARA